MDAFVVNQISFWYTVYEVKPAYIVDKIIAFWLNIVVPGRGTGESHWFMRGLRSLEQGSERVSRELDIRRQLRQWDQDYPEIHHELIVRWICGAAVSMVVSSFYSTLRPTTTNGSASRGTSSRPYGR